MNISPKTAALPRLTPSSFKTVFSLFLISLLMVACVTSQQRLFQEAPESRVALVIGNAHYHYKEIPSLDNPLRDAIAMSKTLKQVGFEVIEAHNADESTMKAKFEEFGTKLKNTPAKDGKKVALFYYSGHGALQDGDSFLFPVDFPVSTNQVEKKESNKESNIVSQTSLAEETASNEPSSEIDPSKINLSKVTETDASSKKKLISLREELFDKINHLDTTTNIFILDACRNNPALEENEKKNSSLLLAKNDTGKGKTRGTKDIKALGWSNGTEGIPDPDNSLIAYATASGEVAKDGEGTNSPYTQHLLQLMTKPGLNVTKLFQEVGRRVKKEIPNQRPWQYGSLDEEFYFVGMVPPEIRGGFK